MGSALEWIVAATWHEALGVPPASLDEDFFDAGGHSLLAGEVAARLAQALDIDVPLAMVFEQPSVRAQAAWLAQTVAPRYPTGRPLGARTSITWSWRLFPPALAAAIREVARHQATDPEVALVAAVAAVLADGRERLVIGMPAGPAIAAVPVDLRGDPSFVTLVDLARRAVPRALAAAAGLVPGAELSLDAFAGLGDHPDQPGIPSVQATFDGDALRIATTSAPLLDRLATLLEGIRGHHARPLSSVFGTLARAPVTATVASPPLPVTHAQERLWFLETLAPGTTANHIQRVYRVDGPLRLDVLERALAALAARHPALRTVFRTGDDGVQQRVLPALPLEHRVDRGGDVATAAREEHERPFALGEGPLWRTRVIAVGPIEHHLILTIHHLVVDALSVIVWLRELAEHYHAIATGGVPRVPPLGTSIAEIAAWERSPAGRARGEADLAFWLDRLAGVRPLDLPLDFKRPRTPGVGRHEIHELLSAERAAELRALGRKRNATLNVTLFAAAAAFLSRLTGQDDLVCVVPAARRDEPGREAVIGLLLNLLPLRLRLDGDPSFAELIARTDRAMREAIAHAESPFERIVAGLGIAREPGRQPLLDVIINMVPGTELTRRGDLRFAMDASANSAQPCDLVIGAATRPGGVLDLMLRCRDDVFAEITAQRMMKRFVALLLAAHANPALPLSELPIMPDDERALVTVTWNATAMPLPEVSVHELVGAQLARSPEAIAIAGGMTRGELAHRATRLAHHLLARGVRAGTRVGVAIPPGRELAIAALGVMQAGGVYVPFDAAQPAARLDQLAREVALVLDPAALAIEAPPVALPRVSPDAPAYIVFTSGSTGRPKGVATTHRALVNQILWFRRDVPWRTGDVACMRSSPAFVDSLWELFGPLADGILLAIATTAEMRDPRALAAMAARHGVTRMMVVPSLLRTLLDLGLPPSVTTWLATSEELAPALVRAFRAARPHDRLINLYGASETADQVAAHGVDDPDPWRTPIGRPIANSRLFVLDAGGQPQPIGVAGELAVAGVGVSDGYLGAPSDRFGLAAGERVYRTGDRGRWRHDGVLDYLGRLDHVLKINGVRVDPAEVEAALLAQPELSAAVVTAQPGFDGAARLVAHVVARVDPPTHLGSAPARIEIGPGAGGGAFGASQLGSPPVEIDPAGLRRRLRSLLPETLIPTSIVVLPALPLGPSGKIDRAMLPAIAAVAASTRAPANATEHAVALAWEQLLGHPVGAEDDFFAAGGQSLVAAQLGARLAERFGVELPLPVLFERPTVAAQAAWIEDAIRTTADAAIPRLPPGTAAPLSFAQERLWFAMQLAPGAPAPKLRSALRIDGPLDVARLHAALEQVAERQPALRTVFAEGRQRILPSCPRDHLDVEVADLDDSVRAHLDAERDKPFDLAAGPPWRTRLLRLAPDAHVLIITMHHLITDGISLGVWRDELDEAYRGRALAPLASTIADHAAWQTRAGDAPTSRAFWRATLAGAVALDLPLAAPRTAWSTRSGRVRAELDDAEGHALAELARAEHTTVFAVLLAGAAATLREITGTTDLVIGTIAAGRDRPEVRPLIGLFLNPLPLRVDASPCTLRALVRRAGATTRAALAHGEVPFERIVADAKPARQPFRQPLFDVVLNHHPLADPPRLGELAVRHVRGVTAPVAPYELMIRTIARRGVTVQLDFQRERFEAETVEAWLARYVAVLRAMIADPDRAA